MNVEIKIGKNLKVFILKIKIILFRYLMVFVLCVFCIVLI